MLESIRPVVLLAALALAVPAVGCGGSDDADPAASQSQEDNAQDTARAKLEQCLRDQGVERPEQPGQLSEAQADEFREAIEGPCREYREDAIGDLSPEEQQEFQDALVKWQACMRDQGIDIPDGAPGQTSQFDPEDPDFQAAAEQCEGILPEQVGGRFGGGG
jgi:hypothetical protein